MSERKKTDLFQKAMDLCADDAEIMGLLSLSVALQSGQKEKLQDALKAYPHLLNYELDGETILLTAVKGGKLESAATLVDMGADIHATAKGRKWETKTGANIVHMAVRSFRPEMMEFVLGLPLKKELNALDHGTHSPLDLALMLNETVPKEARHGIIRHLLAHGAKPDGGGHGTSPLFMACAKEDIEMVQLLLQHKASIGHDLFNRGFSEEVLKILKNEQNSRLDNAVGNGISGNVLPLPKLRVRQKPKGNSPL